MATESPSKKAKTSAAIVLETSLGNITLRLRPDVCPVTCEYISKLVSDGLYDGCCFCSVVCPKKKRLSVGEGTLGITHKGVSSY